MKQFFKRRFAIYHSEVAIWYYHFTISANSWNSFVRIIIWLADYSRKNILSEVNAFLEEDLKWYSGLFKTTFRCGHLLWIAKRVVDETQRAHGCKNQRFCNFLTTLRWHQKSESIKLLTLFNLSLISSKCAIPFCCT